MAAVDSAKSYDIPKKYKACIYDKPGTISTQIVELDTPSPGAGDVLIRLVPSLPFAYEYSWAVRPYPTQPSQIGGHEGVGHVVK
jgi:propanol-preferring alcohol dehydrogenase